MSTSQVLVVDDDDAIRRLICTVLKRVDFATDEARNGEEAIEKLSADGYRAVLLDLMMPVKSGYEVIEYISSRQPEQKCVIVMTAAGTRGAKLVDKSVVHDILYKPFDLDDVVAAVKNCTDAWTPPEKQMQSTE